MKTTICHYTYGNIIQCGMVWKINIYERNMSTKNVGITKPCINNNSTMGTGVQRNFWLWLAKFLTSRHVCMHKLIFYVSNTLRKLMIRAYGLVFKCGGLEKKYNRDLILSPIFFSGYYSYSHSQWWSWQLGGPCHHGSLLGKMRFGDVIMFTQPWCDLFAKLAKFCTVYTLEVMT